jgi:hypothetical protein
MFVATLPHYGLGQSVAQIQSQISSAASAYPNVPNLAQVANAVASHESADQPGAKNPSSSACGLFQLLGVTQQTLGVTNCTDPTQNINAAVPLLASYYQKYGNWPDALQAFSDGPGTVNAGAAPSSQTNGLVSYVQSNAGLDFSDSGDGSSLDLSSIGLPDLSQYIPTSDTLIAGVPDWMTWLGIALAGAAVVNVIRS